MRTRAAKSAWVITTWAITMRPGLATQSGVVILSEPEFRRAGDEGESKDLDNASSAMPVQGISTG